MTMKVDCEYKWTVSNYSHQSVGTTMKVDCEYKWTVSNYSHQSVGTTMKVDCEYKWTVSNYSHQSAPLAALGARHNRTVTIHWRFAMTVDFLTDFLPATTSSSPPIHRLLQTLMRGVSEFPWRTCWCSLKTHVPACLNSSAC